MRSLRDCLHSFFHCSDTVATAPPIVSPNILVHLFIRLLRPTFNHPWCMTTSIDDSVILLTYLICSVIEFLLFHMCISGGLAENILFQSNQTGALYQCEIQSRAFHGATRTQDFWESIRKTSTSYLGVA